MKFQKVLSLRRNRRRFRVRNKLRVNLDRPRLTVFRSNQHIYCQVVDDRAGKTLASASTRDKGLRPTLKFGGNKDAATAVGKAIAERALAAGVKEVRFDRGMYKFHGRVQALAEAARGGGLVF